MKFIDIRKRLIEIDVNIARDYKGSDSMQEYLLRMAATIEELLEENRQLREATGVQDNWWVSK